MKIWTITTNDDNGVLTDVCVTEQAADKLATDWVESYRYRYPEVDFKRPWREVFEDLCEQTGFIDSISVTEHTVFPSFPTEPIEQAYVKAAQDHFARDGELEIDDNAQVSLGDDSGAYVEAWVWVPEEHVVDL